MHEDHFTIETLPACPMQVIDGVILVLDFLRNIAGSVSDTLENATECAMRHANYKVEQRAFVREASSMIERLVSDE